MGLRYMKLLIIDQVYDRKYTRSTVKTYITKLKKKGFVDTQVKGNYSYITGERSQKKCMVKNRWN